MQIDGDVRVAPEELGQERRDPAQTERHGDTEADETARPLRRLEGERLHLLGVGVDAGGALGEAASESR